MFRHVYLDLIFNCSIDVWLIFCSCWFIIAGSHYNPCDKDHSNDPLTQNRHVGDIIRLEVTDPYTDTLSINRIDYQVILCIYKSGTSANVCPLNCFLVTLGKHFPDPSASFIRSDKSEILKCYFCLQTWSMGEAKKSLNSSLIEYSYHK